MYKPPAESAYQNMNTRSDNQDPLAIAYYVPKVPSIRSTTRYNHAIALANYAQFSVLITNTEPPEQIYNVYNSVHVLGRISSAKHVVERIIQAHEIISDMRNRWKSERIVYITHFAYAQALSGFLSDVKWLVDIYDDPLQLSIRRPCTSPHQITSRILLEIIDKADVGIVTLHPDGPRSQLGFSTEYALNGSPTSLIKCRDKPQKPPLRCVWVGKTRVGSGIEILLRSLTHVRKDISVDVYGSPDSNAKCLAESLNVEDKVNFHGKKPHSCIISAIEVAHVGLCVLKPYVDFEFSYPIKVGEYLAAGTIPVMSDFPGMRALAKDAGIYIEPNHCDLGDKLQELVIAADSEISPLANEARKRAEAISWEKERERFASHVVESV